MKARVLSILLGAAIAAAGCGSEAPAEPEPPPEDPLAAATKIGPDVEKATGFERPLEQVERPAKAQPLTDMAGRQAVTSVLPKGIKVEQLIRKLPPELKLKTTAAGKTQTHRSHLGARLEWSWQTVANTELFGEGGSCPTDVNQGSIGDAYFLASLAALAVNDPSALTDMVEENSDGNGDGTYTVTFNQVVASEIGGFAPDGRKVPIRIDAKLPFVEGNSDTLLGAQLVDRDGDGQVEIGVALIEKAYAAYLEKQQLSESGARGYDGIEGGFCDVALTVLGGERYIWSATSRLSATELWHILSKTNNGMPAVAVSLPAANDACDGIVAGHAYTVLGTFADPDSGAKHVALRNPWGRHEPDADGADDGVFSFALAACKKCFSEIDYPADSSGYSTTPKKKAASTSPLSFLADNCR